MTRGDGCLVHPRAARRGDNDGLAALWATYQPALLRYLRGRSCTAPDDVASHVWIDAARGLRRFDGDEAEFRAWLFTIAHRRYVDGVRAARRRADGEARVAAMAPASGATEPESDALARALALVRRLPPDIAEAVLLRIVVDLGVAAVAAIMGKREGNVRMLVHRGLHRLSSILAASATAERRSDERRQEPVTGRDPRTMKGAS
jgi:RNA polymerase sigma-70 factor (ECF subfamily)